jgi:predicted ATPase
VVVVLTAEGQQRNHAPSGTTFLRGLVEQRLSPYPSIAEALTSSTEYRLELDKLTMAAVPQPGIVLEPSGANLAAVLDVMQNSPDRSDFEALQKALHDAIPTLRGIVLPPAAKGPGAIAGAKALEFILSQNGQSPVTIPASLASGGSLLLSAYLTLAYTQTPGLLLIEEPENGLHPNRLQMVLDLMRKMSRGEVGNRKRQIVLTTHNPLLLNYAKPEEVRVFVRDPEQGTRVFPMTKVADIDRLLNEFALGELWYMLGEERLFEEQPA